MYYNINLKSNLCYSVITCWLLVHTLSHAQPKKVKVPEVLATGQIIDATGSVVGTFDKGGNVLNAEGKVVAIYMSPSTLYATDKETRYAKTDIQGSLYVIQEDGKMKPYKLEQPENGAKEHILKDKDGTIKGKVHRNFVDGGSAALYILNTSFFSTVKANSTSASTAKQNTSSVEAKSIQSAKSTNSQGNKKVIKKKPAEQTKKKKQSTVQKK